MSVIFQIPRKGVLDWTRLWSNLCPVVELKKKDFSYEQQSKNIFDFSKTIETFSPQEHKLDHPGYLAAPRGRE